MYSTICLVKVAAVGDGHAVRNEEGEADGETERGDGEHEGLLHPEDVAGVGSAPKKAEIVVDDDNDDDEEEELLREAIEGGAIDLDDDDDDEEWDAPKPKAKP